MTAAGPSDDGVATAASGLDGAIAAIEAHFGSLVPGTRVTREVTFSEQDVAAYCARTGIPYPGRHVDAGGAHLVPPGMVFFPPARVFGLHDGPPLARNGIFTATARSYRRAVRVGETITFRGELTDKFERAGFFYIVAGWDAVDAEGREVASGVEEHTLGSARKRRAS